MANKRDTPEALLQQVVTDLESGLERDEPPRVRGAVLALLARGPLLCSDALRQELDHPSPDIAVIGAELVAFLREVVRLRGATIVPSGYGIGLKGRMHFFAPATDARVTLVAAGSLRDVAVLQLVLLLDQVGLHNIQFCPSPGCPKLFIKSYRRLFCSLRCQQREMKRRSRQKARDQQEQQSRSRRRRRRVTTRQQKGRS